MVEIPSGYELDDYPLKESIAMENGEVVFQYNPIIMKDKVQISAKVEIRKPKIDVRQYGNLKYFMESVATKMNAPIVFKKSRRSLKFKFGLVSLFLLLNWAGHTQSLFGEYSEFEGGTNWCHRNTKL